MIKGRRINLKLLEPEDLEVVFSILSQPENYTELVYDNSSLIYSNMIPLLGQTKPGTTAKIFGIWTRDNVLVGVITANDIHPVHRTMSVGCVAIDHDYKGAGADAVITMADYVFNTLNLNKGTANCWNRDGVVGKLFKALGGQLEAIYREDTFMNGQYRDKYRFGVLESEYRASKYGKR